jgi:hypothetical protein
MTMQQTTQVSDSMNGIAPGLTRITTSVDVQSTKVKSGRTHMRDAAEEIEYWPEEQTDAEEA